MLNRLRVAQVYYLVLLLVFSLLVTTIKLITDTNLVISGLAGIGAILIFSDVLRLLYSMFFGIRGEEMYSYRVARNIRPALPLADAAITFVLGVVFLCIG